MYIYNTKYLKLIAKLTLNIPFSVSCLFILLQLHLSKVSSKLLIKLTYLIVHHHIGFAYLSYNSLFTLTNSVLDRFVNVKLFELDFNILIDA